MRRGVALLDALLAGVMLAVGLAVILSLASRSIAAQASGQRQLVASWLIDEMLSMVVVEGPDVYPKLYATHGRFDEPFQDYEFDLDIKDIGLRLPYRVTATVRWEQAGHQRQVQTQTYISQRQSDVPEIRTPPEPIDRLGRWYDEEGS
jgi:hypothetical protein